MGSVLRTDDQALSAKLAAELKYEKESAASAEPDFLQELKSEGIWSVSEPGSRLSSELADTCACR